MHQVLLKFLGRFQADPNCLVHLAHGREIVVKNLWDKKDMTKEDLVWVVHQLIKNINLNAKEFIDLQKTLKNILHTGSVKLNLYNLALIGQPAFNSGL